MFFQFTSFRLGRNTRNLSEDSGSHSPGKFSEYGWVGGQKGQFLLHRPFLKANAPQKQGQGSVCMLRSPGGSHGEEGGLGRKRFSYPPFHRQSKAPNWVREQKVAAFGAMSPREPASLYPPLAKGVPIQPASSLHTHSPSPSSDREPKSPKDKGETTRRVRNSNSAPRAQIGLRRSEIITGGREGKSGGAGDHSPRSGPGGGSQPRTMGRGAKGRGQGASGVEGGLPPGAACS